MLCCSITSNPGTCRLHHSFTNRHVCVAPYIINASCWMESTESTDWFPNPFHGLGGGGEDGPCNGDIVAGLLYVQDPSQEILTAFGQGSSVIDDKDGRNEEILLKTLIWLRVLRIRRCSAAKAKDTNGDTTEVWWEDLRDRELWLPSTGGLLNGGRWLHMIETQ